MISKSSPHMWKKLAVKRHDVPSKASWLLNICSAGSWCFIYLKSAFISPSTFLCFSLSSLAHGLCFIPAQWPEPTVEAGAEWAFNIYCWVHRVRSLLHQPLCSFSHWIPYWVFVMYQILCQFMRIKRWVRSCPFPNEAHKLVTQQWHKQSYNFTG